MKKFDCLLLIGLLAISMISHAQPWHEQRSFDPEIIALRFMESMVQGDFKQAAMSLDISLKESLTPEKLKSSWKCLTSQAGKFKKHNDIRTESIHHYKIVIIKCEFERCQPEIQIVLNQKGKIAGFTISPKMSSLNQIEILKKQPQIGDKS